MKKQLFFSLMSLLMFAMVLSSCKKEESYSYSESSKIVTVMLYGTADKIVGISTIMVKTINGKNTLSCVDRDLNGNTLDEYTIENVSDLAVNLIGTWKSTSYTYTNSDNPSWNESGYLDDKKYLEEIFTAKNVSEHRYEDGKIVEYYNGAAYKLDGNTMIVSNGNTSSININIDGNVMTLTRKENSQTWVYKFSRE